MNCLYIVKCQIFLNILLIVLFNKLPFSHIMAENLEV